MKQVAVLFAHGFEELEAVAIVDVLRRAEIEAAMVGVEEMMVEGAHGIQIQMDRLLSDIVPDDLYGLVLPGGMPGARNLAESEAVKALIRFVNNREGIIGAICAAPIALHAAGVVTGRTITCYPGFEHEMEEANCTGLPVEVDGHIVTGHGAGAALVFALQLVAQLGDPQKAEELSERMLLNA